MTEFLGSEDVATLGDWVAAIRALAGGGVDASQLCHTDEQTPHRAERGGETYYFQCFYDAVALAHIRDERVGIRTESPRGSVVRATASGSSLETTPGDAVVSFGVARDATAAGDEPTIGEMYGAICPYVTAFPGPEAYESWADEVGAETVAFPLSAGMPVAGALVA